MLEIFFKKFKVTSRALMVLVFLIIIILSGIVWKIYNFKTIPLSEQNLSLEIGLVAVINSSSTVPFLTFYRLNDGQEQSFPGKFKYHFTRQDQALVFGMPSNVTSSQYFVVLEPKAAQIKNIAQLPGSIVQAIPSANGRFVLLSGLVNPTKATDRDQKFYSCIVFVGAADYSSCQFLDKNILKPQLQKDYKSGVVYEAAWHPQQDNTLLISERGHKNRLFVYNISSKKLTDITTSSQEIANLTTSSTTAQAIKKNYVTQIGPFTWIKSGTRTYGLLLKIGTKVSLLEDGLALAEDTKALWIINLATRTKSLVTELPPPHERHVEHYVRKNAE